MNKLIIFTPRTLAVLFVIFSAIFLQGCGAERSYPFGTEPCSSSSAGGNSGENSSCYVKLSSSSSSVSSSSTSSSTSSSSSSDAALSPPLQNVIEAIPNASGVSTANPIAYSGKIVQVITNETEFKTRISEYLSHDFVFDLPNFTEGKVVLIDDGVQDNCTNQPTGSNEISAQEISNTTLKIIVNRKLITKAESCSASSLRPFQFFYVRSTKAFIFDERTSP